MLLHARRDINQITLFNILTFRVQKHFSLAFQYEINFKTGLEHVWDRLGAGFETGYGQAKWQIQAVIFGMKDFLYPSQITRFESRRISQVFYQHAILQIS